MLPSYCILQSPENSNASPNRPLGSWEIILEFGVAIVKISRSDTETQWGWALLSFYYEPLCTATSDHHCSCQFQSFGKPMCNQCSMAGNLEDQTHQDQGTAWARTKAIFWVKVWLQKDTGRFAYSFAAVSWLSSTSPINCWCRACCNILNSSDFAWSWSGEVSLLGALPYSNKVPCLVDNVRCPPTTTSAWWAAGIMTLTYEWTALPQLSFAPDTTSDVVPLHRERDHLNERAQKRLIFAPWRAWFSDSIYAWGQSCSSFLEGSLSGLLCGVTDINRQKRQVCTGKEHVRKFLRRNVCSRMCDCYWSLFVWWAIEVHGNSLKAASNFLLCSWGCQLIKCWGFPWASWALLVSHAPRSIQ